MKLHERVAGLLGISILLTSIQPLMGRNIDSIKQQSKDIQTVQADANLMNNTTSSAIEVETVGSMKLPAIDPITNPAQDNWLSREVARQIFEDETKFAQLTQAHFNIVKHIQLSQQGITYIPKEIGNLTNLDTLHLEGNAIQELPKEFVNLEKLTYLYLQDNNLQRFPEELLELNNLKYLNISSNHNISNLPEEIGKLEQLETLEIKAIGLTELPDSIGNLSNLKTLGIAYNKLKNLSKEISNLTELKILDLTATGLEEFPQIITSLSNLEELILNSNSITNLPNDIDKLVNLKTLMIDCNKLKALPDNIVNLKSLEQLEINNNSLECLPEDIGNLGKLKILSLFTNNLTDLPSSISELTGLQQLSIAQNKIRNIPEKLKQLQVEIYANNQSIILEPITIDENEELIIENPIYCMGENVIPNESADIEYDEEKHTIKFNIDKLNTSPKEFSFYRQLGEYGSFSGTVTQPFTIRPTVEQPDVKQPIILAQNTEIWQGEVFDPLKGVTALDGEGNLIPLTEIHVIKNEVKEDVPGTYVVEYEVTDTNGITVRKVIQVTVRQLEMNRTSFIVGEEIKPLDWITITDEGDINKVDVRVVNSNIPFEEVDGKVYFAESGKFEITYKATDEQGKSITVTFEITVEDKPDTGDKPDIENKPDTEDKPDTGNKPDTEDKPDTENKPDTEDNPNLENKIYLHKPYIQGYPNQTFGASRSVTRAEFAMMLTNILKENEELPEEMQPFSDVSETHFAYKAIHYLASQGIIRGYENGLFKPEEAITRAEVSAILSRVKHLQGTKEVKDYIDVGSTHWAYEAIQCVTNANYLVGYEDGSFKPDYAITRAEIVAMLNRIYRGQHEIADFNVDTIPFSDVQSSHWAYKDILEASIEHQYKVED